MPRIAFALVLCAWLSSDSLSFAQDYVGPSSMGSSEPLYPYDDQEKWKHGYIQEMPYNHGWHSFRPYNYHHVFGQSQAAAGWGMPNNMPYSQQFWHRYAPQANLSSGQTVSQYAPATNQFQHYRPANVAQSVSYGQDFYAPQIAPTAATTPVYPQPLPVIIPQSGQQQLGGASTSRQQRQLNQYLEGPSLGQ